MINITKKREALIIFLTESRIDISNVGNFSQALKRAITKKPKRISINLKDVRYLDSSALGVLMTIFKEVEKYGGLIQLTHLSKDLIEMFSIVGLEDYLKICD